jgi:hypothetical protein
MTESNVTSGTILTEEQQIYLWLRAHRGLCSKVAREHGVSREFVRKILYGLGDAKSAGFRIERSLADMGAPFMENRLEREIGVPA